MFLALFSTASLVFSLVCYLYFRNDQSVLFFGVTNGEFWMGSLVIQVFATYHSLRKLAYGNDWD